MKPLQLRLPERLRVGSAADLQQLWREWRSKRKPVVLRPYVDLNTGGRKAARYITPLVLTAACFVYGFFFALTAPALIVPFVAPVLVLALLGIWALPETHTVPLRTMEVFFILGLAGLIFWPNYLALSLKGLPWITVARLTIFPAVFLLLFSVSSSARLRKQILDSASGVPVVLPLLILIAANSLLTLPISKSVGASLNKIIVEQFTWTGMFLAALYVFRLPGRAERYVAMVLLMGPPIALLALTEFEEQHVLWLQHVPSFLRVPDPAVQLSLASQTRSATGQYRAKTTFPTGLGLAEYISLLTPFALHWAAGRGSMVKRLAGVLMLPIIYVVVRMTDSRLGILGYLVSVASFVLIWSLIRFRRRLNDLVAAIVVYAYPAALLGVLAASVFVHKIHVLIFGGGATSASNSARTEQFRMAMPPFLRNPLGYGDAMAGDQMGYGTGDFTAIDSYWITLSLDYGAVGMVLFVGLFTVVIYAAVKTLLDHPQVARGETRLLLPLISFLAAFLVIRGVYAEEMLFPLVYAMLAMAVCLVSRAKHKVAADKPVKVAAAPVAQVTSRKHRVEPLRVEEKKPMSFATVVVVVLVCAAGYYVACLLWLLTHR